MTLSTITSFILAILGIYKAYLGKQSTDSVIALKESVSESNHLKKMIDDELEARSLREKDLTEEQKQKLEDIFK